MKHKELVLIGGGGHCRSCISVIQSGGDFSIKGVLDLQENVGSKVLDYPIMGSDQDILNYIDKGYSFLVTIGHTGDVELRNRIFQTLLAHKAHIPTIIASSAQVCSSALVGKGSIVMHNAVVNACASVGENCIINTQSLVEHDAEVGSGTHVSTGAIVNGGSRVGFDCFVGSGAVLRNAIDIAPKTTIGMGAVVSASIHEAGIYFGNPAKIVR